MVYKELPNKTKLFIITKTAFKDIDNIIDASCGYRVDYVLIERSIYNKVRDHKDLWPVCQSILDPKKGKIEIF